MYRTLSPQSPVSPDWAVFLDEVGAEEDGGDNDQVVVNNDEPARVEYNTGDQLEGSKVRKDHIVVEVKRKASHHSRLWCGSGRRSCTKTPHCHHGGPGLCLTLQGQTQGRSAA